MKNLILPFERSDEIETFYSQAGQDIFVLSVLNGMSNGLFLDIGCNDPKTLSNSYLLENRFGWSGILFDIDAKMVDLCKTERNSKCVCGDATTIDYSRLLKEENFPHIIDYMSVDIDGIYSFNVLEKIPFVDYKFRVITFEHNYYDGYGKTRELSRKYLDDLGYFRLCSNVMNDGCAFEDWYVHPELVDIERARVLKYDNFSKEWRDILFQD